MNTTSPLKEEIERIADELGISPSTVGERAGQGGHFYKRLCEGKRVWPDTEAKVRERLQSFVSPSAGVSSDVSQRDSHLAGNANGSAATQRQPLIGKRTGDV